MTDKTALLSQANEGQEPVDAASEDASTANQNGVGDGHPDHRQRIFDERFGAVMDAFGEACEQEKIDLAVAIAIHPKEQQPLVFVRGHEYDVAKLLAHILRSMKAQLYAGLDAEPGGFDPDLEEEDEQ